MKRFLCGLGGLLAFCSVATAQVSLLNEATNGLFKNVNDFVIKPNIMFNTVETKQIIIGGGFDNLGFDSDATGGGLIGYFHPSSIPWSVAGSFDLASGNHPYKKEVKTGNTTTTTEWKNPAFENYKGGVRFTLGIPSAMNLSVGAEVRFEGNSMNGDEMVVTTTTLQGGSTEIKTFGTETEKFKLLVGIPVGMEFTQGMYNFFEFFVNFEKSTTYTVTANGTLNAARTEKVTNSNSFMVYDKFTIQNLIPEPFGAETSFWLGIGNADLTDIPEVETPAYGKATNVDTEIKFSTQIGASNLIDLSMGDIELRFKPMVYFDLLLGIHKSWTFGTTIAASAGTYVPLGNLPLKVFFGVTPAFQFYNSVNIKQPNGNANNVEYNANRRLTTNVLWSGKLGTSILLPKDMVLDVALEMDSGNLGLSAQMTVAL